jgi:hypothetical protein
MTTPFHWESLYPRTERGKAYPLRLRLRLSENCRSIPVGAVDHWCRSTESKRF